MGNLLGESHHRDDEDLLWVSQKFEQFSSHERFWSRDIDWLDVYYLDDSAKRHDKEARIMAHGAHADATDILLRLVNAASQPLTRTRGGWYYFLIRYHIRYLFDYAPFEKATTPHLGDRSSVPTWLPRDLAPYPIAAKEQTEIWQGRIRTYFARLPVLVEHMLQDAVFQNAGLSRAKVETAWVLMMFRAFCWSRTHTMLPRKPLDVKWCGSQIPTYLA